MAVRALARQPSHPGRRKLERDDYRFSFMGISSSGRSLGFHPKNDGSIPSIPTNFMPYTRVMHDAVNHPAHYTQGKIEVLDFIEDQKLGFHLGNVIKYICRSPYKGNEIQDLKKAQNLLGRKIALLEEEFREE